MSRSASLIFGVERSAVASVGYLLGWSLVVGMATGCRSLDPTGSQGSGRIPPPATGSYTIPTGAARSGSEPYYSRPEASAAGAAGSAPAAGGSSTQRSGSWYQVPANSSPASGTAPSPTIPLPAPPATGVAPASFSAWQGNEPQAVVREGVVRADFTETVPTGTAEPVATSEGRSASDEPGRIVPSGTLLPTEAGAIGSGVRTVSSTEVPADAGRRAGSSTTAPRPISVDDLLNAGSNSTWRPRF